MAVKAVAPIDAVTSFLDYGRDIKQLSPLTLKHYQRDLDALLASFPTDPALSLSDIKEHHIRAWANSLRRRGLGASSIARHLSAARSWLEFCVKKYRLPNNPAVGISAPKRSRKLPKTMDVDQLAQCLKSTSDSDIECRDLALAELLYSCGLRLAEVQSLTIAHIDRHQQTVTVTGKGNKTRQVPIGRVAIEALSHWLRIHPLAAVLEPSTPLFTTRQGKALSARSIQTRLSKLAQRNGLASHVHPHMLRHSFASHILESSGDLRAVQELLGHSNISTTQIYTHLDFQHLAKTYDATHPRAKRSKT